MKIVVQRALESKVLVSGQVVGEIDHGLVLLICFEKDDDKDCIEKSVNKILNLRIFEDENAKMNKSIIETGGKLLCVSQFTLSWNGKKGNRPSFDNSMKPTEANDLFMDLCEKFKEKKI